MTSDYLSKLNTFLDQHSYGSRPPELYEPIYYTMSMGGKRMRPLLCLLAYSLYRDNYEKALPAAAAVEVFHNFTLLHDDIMDQAPLRRGKPTVHERWSTPVAILSGDVMMVKAYDLLLDLDHRHPVPLIRKFNVTAAEVCEGQQIDMNFEQRATVSVEEYLDMIKLKTAVLLGYSVWSGAFLAGASHRDCDTLYDLGVAMGIGFQLTDDLLDVFADQAKFGKQVGGDIISNKKTYLLIRALEDASEAQKKNLQSWLEKKEFDKAVKVEAVTQIYKELGIEEKTRSLISSYFDKAFNLASQLQVNSETSLVLRNYMEQLIGRDH
jgi:geranylgeranyl diphosphate synthase, type II